MAQLDSIPISSHGWQYQNVGVAFWPIIALYWSSERLLGCAVPHNSGAGDVAWIVDLQLCSAKGCCGPLHQYEPGVIALLNKTFSVWMGKTAEN